MFAYILGVSSVSMKVEIWRISQVWGPHHMSASHGLHLLGILALEPLQLVDFHPFVISYAALIGNSLLLTISSQAQPLWTHGPPSRLCMLSGAGCCPPGAQCLRPCDPLVPCWRALPGSLHFSGILPLFHFHLRVWDLAGEWHLTLLHIAYVTTLWYTVLYIHW